MSYYCIMMLFSGMLAMLLFPARAEESVQPAGCDECPVSFDPVCGTNHVTYNNICGLERDNCVYGTDLSVLFHNACEDGEENSTPLSCGDDFCASIWEPVCGTDHRNYINTCALQKRACQSESQIVVKHKGFCTADEKPIQTCRTVCSTAFRPVCGTDGKEYKNKCVLEAEACKTNKRIEVKHTGLCRQS
eukprot:GHVS01056051.1.p1 GENE.GHVS01056051.1~~GHVS01056051.1.p1  ORF type:complete len:190 (-),score=22.17 GHVS01056051.1:693-1262(-)